MIHNLDRSGYFGASDTKYVVANNRNTKTWKQWWEIKLGSGQEMIHGNKYTGAGDMYEHPILLSINEKMDLDGQIIHDKYPIRVNYDGFINGTIYEVKTHKGEKEFEMSNAYWMQCQVEMYVYQEMHRQWFLPPFKQLYLVSYGLNPDEYGAYAAVDPNRLVYHPVAYDKTWIKGEYLPKVKELTRALKKGKFPG